jgi:hypothetical protein
MGKVEHTASLRVGEEEKEETEKERKRKEGMATEKGVA